MPEAMIKMNNVKPANIFQVVKKSGQSTVFNENKLQISIEKALHQAGIEKNSIVPQLVDDVMKKLEDELSYRESISTLDIREAVEISLLERGLTKVASFYHDFASHDAEDKEDDFMDNIDETETADEDNKTLYSDATIAEIIDKKKFTPVAPEFDDHIPEALAIDEPSVIQDTVSELPAERESVTYKFDFAGVSGYVTVSLFNDRTPGEIMLHSLSSSQGLNVNKIKLFFEIMNTSLQNGVGLDILLYNILSSFTDEDDVEMRLLQHVCEWLNNRF